MGLPDKFPDPSTPWSWGRRRGARARRRERRLPPPPSRVELMDNDGTTLASVTLPVSNFDHWCLVVGAAAAGCIHRN